MDDETPLAKIIEAQLIGSAKCAAERGRKPTWGELARDVAALPEVADTRIASRLEADEEDVERVKAAILEAMDITDGLDVTAAETYARAAILAMRRAAQE